MIRIKNKVWKIWG